MEDSGMADITQNYIDGIDATLAGLALSAPSGGGAQKATTEQLNIGAIQRVNGNRDILHDLIMLNRDYETFHFRIETRNDGTSFTQTTLDDTGLTGYLVPWSEDKTWGIDLRNTDANFLFTAPMNGCCVVVQGDNASRPMFFHANYGKETPYNGSLEQYQQDREKDLAARTTYYDNLLPKLRAKLPEQEAKSSVQTAFRPEFYMDEGKGITPYIRSSAFGFRLKGGEWIFFYHVVFGSANKAPEKPPGKAVRVGNTNFYSVTGQLWPDLKDDIS
jgi:hypothetical protein